MPFNVDIPGEGTISCDGPVTGRDIMGLSQTQSPGRHVVAWRVNQYLRPLSWVVDDDAVAEFVDTSDFEGISVYRSTLSFLLVIACRRVLGRDILIRHAISDGYFCEPLNGNIAPDDVPAIRAGMNELIEKDLPITWEVLSLDRARRVFERQGDTAKASLLHSTGIDPVTVYRCAGVYGFFYVPLAPSTGYMSSWGLEPFDDGMVLRFPTVAFPKELPPFRVPEKLAGVFFEYSEWLDILDVGTMESLHRHVTAGRATELILVSEALHSRRLSHLAEKITQKNGAKLVCLAGPSGSGKTTTAHRLGVSLKVCGARPVAISLDDYFLERDKTPRDEDGNYNFEALEALDLDLINEHLSLLMEGGAVRVPRFNFLTGRREQGSEIQLKDRDLLIIEGIHGLNERLTGVIPRASKFKIYISPLTGISLDRHNRTSTTDNRLLRRLVRDCRIRGKSAGKTLAQWPSVIRGAQKYIFPYQERADEMFNSALVYELSVLKGYAEPLLRTVEENDPVYGDAQRLLNLLRYVPFIPSDTVPNTSILREFIGGSCFQ